MNIFKYLIRIFADTRPFWWLNETTAYSDFLRPKMRQTQHSCETTPGCPSGHTMVNAALMYVVVVELLQSQKHRSAKSFHILKIICWIMFSVHVMLVSTSRMYFGCHFLHQCVLGVALGMVCTKYMLGPAGMVHWILRANVSKLCLVTTALVSTAFAIYFGHILIGADPLWSIRMVSLFEYKL